MKTTLLLILGLAVLSGCTVGPNYQRPTAPVTAAFAETGPWHPAAPHDDLPRAGWWRAFGDPQLDALEVRLQQGNFSLQQADADFRAARAAIRFNRAAELPTVGVAPYAGLERISANQPYFNAAAANSGAQEYSLPLDLNYEVDLWGRIRRSVTAARASAQASAADRENIRLSLEAELALDYFDLRSSVAQQNLLDATVSAYAQALALTQERYAGGASPLSDVAQARAQLEAARVQATDVGTRRAGYGHAIAVLLGLPPAEARITVDSLMQQAPAIPTVPVVLPAELLQRRPDIAAAERRMAAANEQIGIAQAAFYPSLNLGGNGGLLTSAATTWFAWPSRFWAVGATLSDTLFDHGRRRANSDIARANYDSTVAAYRESVLGAFQEVEDNLADLRQLDAESQQQHAATDAAHQTLDLFQRRYEGGVDTYLQVITWQTNFLQNQRNDIELYRRRLEASVLLVKAAGGGWSMAELPSLARS